MTVSCDHIDIKGRGTAAISNNCSDIGIDNVLYTPDSAMNLLSVSRLTESDLDILFRKGKAYVYKDGKAMFTPLADARHAKEELERLIQSSSVTEYIRAFTALVTRIPNMTNDEKRRQFVQGLKTNIRRAVDRANPAILEDAFTVALTEDIDFVASAATPQTTQQRNMAPQSTAIDVDAIQAPCFNRLTDKEHAYLRSTNACFRCRQPGHRSNACPLNRSRPRQQQFHQRRGPQVNSFEGMPQYYHGYPVPFGHGFMPMPMFPGYNVASTPPQQQ
ncbi:hypothetical protein IWW39_001180 [Coemansia spiralis]|uniref:CCHC-type domain-containing protein n=1 Tax=Coemansia spiralis TaxID=417178 RepID=A0A9W8GIF2_9FUNG|nr:hypothetical protein IWW39_001180 [Coemansia spiralis]